MEILNKRRHPRAPLNAKMITIASGKPKVHLIRNISSSGVFIESVDLYKIGTEVFLLFPLHHPEKTAQTHAKVVRRVEPIFEDDFTTPGMGLEFFNTPFETSVLIEDYVVKVKYIYEELLLLVNMKKPDMKRLGQLLKKIRIEEYYDFFELKEKIKRACFSLGILEDIGEE